MVALFRPNINYIWLGFCR